MSANRIAVMDENAVRRALARMAREIVERNGGTRDLALMGIHRRGTQITDLLRAEIERAEGVQVPIGSIDITLYRDDLSRARQQPTIKGTDIRFPIDDRRVLLVDDVLYTGRTVRAALDALMDFGRPQNVQLVVLIDRGHRELPIRADFVGKNLPTAVNELVQVRLTESDGRDEVAIAQSAE